MRRSEVEKFIRLATECSVYVSPAAPGLSDAELVEVGGRLGYQKGEIADTMRGSGLEMDPRSGRWLPSNPMWADFIFPVDPDFRNLDAFEFVRRHVRELARSEGESSARVDRDVLVELGAAKGLPRNDIEVAVAVLCLSELLREEDGVLRPAPGRAEWPLPSEQRAQARDLPRVSRPDDLRARVYTAVEDVVQRRSDGRSQSSESLDAFAGALADLGYGHFTMWWRQTLAELRRADPNLLPVSTVVLAAALVEGALSFVVRHARDLNLGVFRSSDFDGSPKQWRIDKLIKSASGGGETAVLDNGTRTRAELLVRARQRIHAGRMLSEYRGAPPDLRPEEARDAKQTANVVVRGVLDWLQRYPPSTKTPASQGR
jgi:hypothetical protein